MIFLPDISKYQRRQWLVSNGYFREKMPGFSYIWTKCLHNHKGDLAPVWARFTIPYNGQPGIACTDGMNIVFNPDTFFKPLIEGSISPERPLGIEDVQSPIGYDNFERVFIMGHEVSHAAMNDPGLLKSLRGQKHITLNNGKTFPYDEGVMQKCMDYCRNAMLVESRCGHMPKDALYDPDIAKAGCGVFEAYERVYRQEDNGGPKNPGDQPGHGNAQGQNGWDPGGVLDHGGTLPPEATATQPAPPRNDAKWEMAAKIAAGLQKAAGNMSASIQGMFDELLDPHVSWQDHIECLIKRMWGDSSSDWRRPDRRFIGQDIYLPSYSDNSAGWVAVWADTSGSCWTAKDLTNYLSNITAILESCKPSRLTVIWGDSRVKHIDDITDMADIAEIQCRGVKGVGGTMIGPMIEALHNLSPGEQPDMFIGMTDGEIMDQWPDQPAYPVIWAALNSRTKYPYGEVVEITR